MLSGAVYYKVGKKTAIELPPWEKSDIGLKYVLNVKSKGGEVEVNNLDY